MFMRILRSVVDWLLSAASVVLIILGLVASGLMFGASYAFWTYTPVAAYVALFFGIVGFVASMLLISQSKHDFGVENVDTDNG